MTSLAHHFWTWTWTLHRDFVVWMFRNNNTFEIECVIHL